MLIAAAADKWRVDPARCRARHGRIENDRGQSFSYGQLAEAAAKLQVPKDVALKPKGGLSADRNLAAAARHAGQGGRQRRVRSGRELPGMLYAVIAQCPALGGQSRSRSTRARAESMPGVRRVLSAAERRGGGGRSFLAGAARRAMR